MVIVSSNRFRLVQQTTTQDWDSRKYVPQKHIRLPLYIYIYLYIFPVEINNNNNNAEKKAQFLHSLVH